MMRGALCCALLLGFGGAATAATAATIRVTVEAASALLAETSSAFLGVNIDSASLFQGARLDFGDADLVALATRMARAGLGGAGLGGDGREGQESRMTLRIGGSAADDLSTFVDDKTHGQIFLDEQYWDEIVAFAEGCGFDLVWDLNMRVGRADDARAAWDPVDARRLISRVRGKDQRVWAYQLGNEPGHWQTRNGGSPNATIHGNDFCTLSALLRSVDKGNLKRNPVRIIGPDVCYGSMTDASPCADEAYFREFLMAAGSGTIDGVSVHAYGLTGPKGGRPANETNCFVADFLNRSKYRESVLPAVIKWQQMARELAPKASFILSETASAADGGCPGLSNTFLAGFYFIDILGEMVSLGVHQVFRQDLVGFSVLAVARVMLCLVTLAGSAAMSRGGLPQILTTSLHSCIVRWWEAEECASAPVGAYATLRSRVMVTRCVRSVRKRGRGCHQFFESGER